MSGSRSSEGHGNDRLRARRRLRRRRILVSLLILFLLLLAGIVYELNQSAVRISNIVVYGADQSYADIASTAMWGSYLGIIPRNSTFFFPGRRIRSDIIALHPDIAAVSLFRNGFTGLSIKVNDRVAIARWCGASSETRSDLGNSGLRSDLVSGCYVFDANGFIFAAAATTTNTINNFTLYAPLENQPLEPLRATVAHAEELPSIFDFARQLDTLGSPTAHIILRGDEVDDYLISGTRVTYVLGNEQNAFSALVSAHGNFNLANGSLEYVDLRFNGKVYLKKKAVDSKQ